MQDVAAEQAVTLAVTLTDNIGSIQPTLVSVLASWRSRLQTDSTAKHFSAVARLQPQWRYALAGKWVTLPHLRVYLQTASSLLGAKEHVRQYFFGTGKLQANDDLSQADWDKFAEKIPYILHHAEPVPEGLYNCILERNGAEHSRKDALLIKQGAEKYITIQHETIGNSMAAVCAWLEKFAMQPEAIKVNFTTLDSELPEASRSAATSWADAVQEAGKPSYFEVDAFLQRQLTCSAAENDMVVDAAYVLRTVGWAAAKQAQYNAAVDAEFARRYGPASVASGAEAFRTRSLCFSQQARPRAAAYGQVSNLGSVQEEDFEEAGLGSSSDDEDA